MLTETRCRRSLALTVAMLSMAVSGFAGPASRDEAIQEVREVRAVLARAHAAATTDEAGQLTGLSFDVWSTASTDLSLESAAADHADRLLRDASSDASRLGLLVHVATELEALEAKLTDPRDTGTSPLSPDRVNRELELLLRQLRPPQRDEEPVQVRQGRTTHYRGTYRGTSGRAGRGSSGYRRSRPPRRGTGRATVPSRSPTRSLSPTTREPSQGQTPPPRRSQTTVHQEAVTAPRKIVPVPVPRVVVVSARPSSAATTGAAPPSPGATTQAPLRAGVTSATPEESPAPAPLLCLMLAVIALGLPTSLALLRYHARGRTMASRLVLDDLAEPELVELGARALKGAALVASSERDWLRALRYEMASLLVDLEAWGLIRPVSARTNRELAGTMQAKPDVVAAFDRLAASFDAHWYGRQPVTEEDVLGFSAGAAELRTRLGYRDDPLDAEEHLARALGLLSGRTS
jgi:hypothetical protein